MSAATRSEEAFDPVVAATRYAALRVRVAREDPNEFCEYVVRNELPAAKGKKIRQAPVHIEMQQIFDEHQLCVLWSHVESGKTEQAIARACFELGKQPNLRIAICSGAEKQAKKITRKMKQLIEYSKELHEVFPALQPGEKTAWGVNEFTVRRPIIAKDPSVQIATAGSGAITGARLDLVILDDILTPVNTRTQESRDKIAQWLDENIISRLTDDSRVWVLGNAQHPDDMMHRLAQNPAWFGKRFPVIRADGKSNWPEVWSLERIEKRRLVLQHRPEEFDRAMMCIARDDVGGRFKRAWIDTCLKRGMGKTLATAGLLSIPPGYRIITGVDIGGLAQNKARRKKSDKTVFFTIAIRPNGDRELLDIRASNQWVGLDVVKMMQYLHQIFGSVFWVEANAAQMINVHLTRQMTSVPIMPFNTGGNKFDPDFGLESMSYELAGGKWVIPSDDKAQINHPEVREWVSEMLQYRPGEHAGDRLMASWIAKEGARMGEKKARKMTINLQKR